jgi:hypothetical protein
MLERVLALLNERGWFDVGQPFEQTIYLTDGAAQCLLLSRGGRPVTFVKFAELVDLEAEASCGLRAHERFPANAPRLYGHVRTQGLSVVAAGAERFTPLGAGLLRGWRSGPRARRGLRAFFARMRELGPDPTQPDHGWFAGMRVYFEAHPPQAAARVGLEHLAASLAGLPRLPQHGDFVTNNLGLRPDGTLVVYDWEDLGAVHLPGLDIFTLEMSLRATSSATEDEAARWIDRDGLCQALGLAPGLYRELRLGYALTFRYLKRNYSPEVRARVDRMVEAVAAGRGDWT